MPLFLLLFKGDFTELKHSSGRVLVILFLLLNTKKTEL